MIVMIAGNLYSNFIFSLQDYIEDISKEDINDINIYRRYSVNSNLIFVIF